MVFELAEIGPMEKNLTAGALVHGGKSFFEFGVFEAMRNH